MRDRDVAQVIPAVHASEPNPVFLKGYIDTLFYGWGILWSVFAALALALGYLGDKLTGHRDRWIFASVAVLPAVACLVGEFDALWRGFYARAAAKRYLQAERVFDDECRRLVRVARLNDGAIMIQLAVGIAVATWFGLHA